MSTSELSITLFERRRRIRRVRMIVDLTSELIRNDVSLTHREARSLLECARKAIDDLSPDYNGRFNRRVAPVLERVIRERWPFEEICTDVIN